LTKLSQYNEEEIAENGVAEKLGRFPADCCGWVGWRQIIRINLPHLPGILLSNRTLSSSPPNFEPIL
jgi:hypothetical protein